MGSKYTAAVETKRKHEGFIMGITYAGRLDMYADQTPFEQSVMSSVWVDAQNDI